MTGALDRVDTNARQTAAVFDVARGTYTFSVFGAASQTGDYEFNINDLSDDPVLALETSVPVSLPRGSDSTSFNLDGRAGQVLSLAFTGVNSSFDGSVTIVSPSGVIIRNDSLRDTNATLNETGTHHVLIEGRLTETDPVNISVIARLSTSESFAYTLGSAVNDVLEAQGDSHVYAFTLASDARLALSGTGAFGAPGWELRSKSGRVGAGHKPAHSRNACIARSGSG